MNGRIDGQDFVLWGDIDAGWQSSLDRHQGTKAKSLGRGKITWESMRELA